MKYEILCSYDVGKLEAQVVSKLQSGWTLQGGVSVAQSDYYSENHKGDGNDNFSQIFIQAMILE